MHKVIKFKIMLNHLLICIIYYLLFNLINSIFNFTNYKF